MKFPDYGKCKIRSVYLAQELEKDDIEISVLFGIFKPNTPRRSWDERWQRAQGSEFVHFWLVAEHTYYDFSAFQFGAKEWIKTECSDTRYERLGHYNYKTGELVNTGNLLINWDSLEEIDGIPVLTMEPVFI